MNPIKDISDVVKNWNDIFERHPRSLYAFFLYTDEDKALAAYVREHFSSLDMLSGNHCLVFLIDEPSAKWKQEALKRDYWREFQLKNLQYKGFIESRPYEKAKAYEIAQYLGVSTRALPCIVFFKNVHEDELLVIPLDSSWKEEQLTKTFRDIFAVLNDVARRIDGEVADRTKKGIKRKRQAMWEGLSSHIRRKKIRFVISKVIHSIRTIAEAFKKIAP